MGERVCVICGRPGRPGRFSCNDCGATIVERAAGPEHRETPVPDPPPAAPELVPTTAPWAVYETATAQPSASTVVTAPSAPAWTPPEAVSSLVRDGWVLPDGTATPSQSRTALKAGLAIVVVLAVAFAGLIGYGVLRAIFGNDPPSALDGYRNGKGVKYSFPRDRTSVRMPEAPELQTMGPKTNALGVVIMLAGVEHKTYEMFFYKYEGDALRHLSAAAVRARLKAAIDGATGATAISIQRTSNEPVGGRPALAMHGTVKGDQADAVFIYAGGKIYGLFVHTKHGSDKVMKAFEKSFHPR